MNLPVPSGRTVRVLLALAALVAVGIVAWLFYLVLSLSAQSHDNAAGLRQAEIDRDVLRAASHRQDAALAEANKRLAEAGKPQVPVPAEPTFVPGPRGPAGANGANASDAQVVAAVNAFCSTRNDCMGPTGPQGITGKPGPAGSKGEAGATGATGAKGDRGPAGADGKDGATGPRGDTGPAGPAGPAGADSTVPGPAGPPGPAGKNGTDGKDAFPFSFSFVVKDNPVHSTTYTCTIKDPSTPATCVAS